MPPKVASKANAPVLLSAEKAMGVVTPGTKLWIGGIWGAVEAGQTWLATDGQRVVMSASGTAVIYVLTPKPGSTAGFYIQSAPGFIGEVTTYPAIEGMRRAAPMVRLVELEVHLLMGVVAATSGVGFFAVIGTDVLKFVVENRDHFGRWSRVLAAALAARSVLKTHAPRLYDKMFDATLIVIVKDVVPASPGAIAPENLSRMVGIVIGKLGRKAAEARLSVLSVVWTILLEVAKKCLTAVPKAISATVGEYKTSADQIIQQLASIGASITPDDVQKIYDEIRAHPREIYEALQKVVEAVGEP